MKLTALGTRGEVEARTRRHRRHSSLLVEYRGRRVMVDAGEDWLGRLEDVAPHAIVVTHAHPDHAFGLRHGAPCPVYATAAAWEAMEDYPIEERHRLAPGRRRTIEGIRFKPMTVEHSLRAPAVVYRIEAGRVAVVYAPDVIYMHHRAETMTGARLYIGDGATLDTTFVRRRPGGHLIGHAPVRTQLTWCSKEGVPEMVVTHCGSQIVEGDERSIGARLRKWAGERGVEVSLAWDGWERVLR